VSGLANFNVWAYDAAGNYYNSGQNTDSGGNYSVSVPLRVTITTLYAERYWGDSGQNPIPPDWAYGPTKYNKNGTLSEFFTSAGSTATGVNFQSYPEAVLSGTYVGTNNTPCGSGGSGWTINLNGEYDQSNGGNNGDMQANCGAAAGSFEYHNVEPGTWHLDIQPNDGVSADLIFDNVLITDGFANTNGLPNVSSNGLVFNGGSSLTVNFSPPATNQSVSVSLHGQNNNNINGVNGTGVSVNGANTVISGLPINQVYDIQVSPAGSNGGSGTYFPDSNVHVGNAGGGPYTTTVNGLNITAAISGTVTDPAGIGFSNLGVYAFPHGYSPANGGTPAVSGAVANSGTYTVSVDPAYNWDLLVLNKNQTNGNSNGVPSIYGNLANVAQGTTTANMATANGVTVSGNVTINGVVPSLEQQSDLQNGNNSGVSAYASGGNWVNQGAIQEGSASYAYSMAGLIAGTYSLNYDESYLTSVTLTPVVVAGTSLTGKNLSAVVDPAQDLYAPWATHLNPAVLEGVTQTVSGTTPNLSLLVSDGALGMGVVAPTAANVKIDGGGLVGAFSYTASTGLISITPTALSQGVTHTVTVTFSDSASTPHTSIVSWGFYVPIPPSPTPTSTVTPSATPTVTRTATDTASMTATRTATATPSMTASLTSTDTPSISPTASFTVSPFGSPTSTSTPTSSFTASPTYTASPTSTDTPTDTPSDTVTNTLTLTSSDTASPTSTDTPTDTPTDSVTNTLTLTFTYTASPTSTDTPTDTPTDTVTNTLTDTLTSTPSFTDSPTDTPSATDTLTGTRTDSPTASPTDTETGTRTSTDTPSDSPTPTPTDTETSTVTDSPTATDTATSTPTPTPIETDSVVVVPGNAASVSTTAGGLVVSMTGAAFPPPAPASVTVSVQVFAADPDPLPSGYVLDGVAYQITATTQVSGTATVLLAFPFSNAPRGVAPTVMYYEDGVSTATQVSTGLSVAWNPDDTSGVITVTTNHFSVWILALKVSATPVPFAQTSSNLGKATWGPVPASVGEPVALYFDKAPASGSFQVYNVAGQQVASASFDQAASFGTGGLAPGVYFVRTVVHYADASSKTLFQKIVLVR